jgi:hypothetical protein
MVSRVATLNFLINDRFSYVRFVTSGHHNLLFFSLLKLFNKTQTEVQRVEVVKTIFPRNMYRKVKHGKRPSKNMQFCEGIRNT